MLHYISFGSGSCGNCSYLFTENYGLLIDAGVGIRTLKKHFKDYNIQLSKANSLIITHDHAKSSTCPYIRHKRFMQE